MRGGDDSQNAAGAGQRPFGGRLGAWKARSQITAPDVRVGVGIVEQAPHDAVSVLEFLPIPTRAERGVGISAPVAGDTRTLPAFERERLHDLRAIAAAETEGAGVGGGREWIAPQQKTLRSRKDAMDDAIAAVFAQHIAVTVAEEAALAIAEREQALAAAALARHLLLANVGLVVRHAAVLRPVLG